MKPTIGTVLAICLTIITAGAGTAVVESRRVDGGQNQSNELRAEFRFFNTDRILSDGLGAYVSSSSRRQIDTVQFLTGPRLEGRVQISIYSWSPAARSLSLQFEDMLRDYRIAEAGGDGYDCRDYRGNQIEVPELQIPPFPLPGSTTAASFLIETHEEVSYNSSTKAWEATRGQPFNVRDSLEVNDTAYVAFNFYFSAGGRGFWLGFNERHWGGLDLASSSGFAQVTRTGENTWVLGPMNPLVPPLANGLPNGTVENFANFFMHVPELKQVHSGGSCDLGDWLMPFEITLTRY